VVPPNITRLIKHKLIVVISYLLSAVDVLYSVWILARCTLSHSTRSTTILFSMAGSRSFISTSGLSVISASVSYHPHLLHWSSVHRMAT